MSFADELRNAKLDLQEKEKEEKEKIWKAFLDFILEDIKCECYSYAEAGNNSCTYSIERTITNFIRQPFYHRDGKAYYSNEDVEDTWFPNISERIYPIINEKTGYHGVAFEKHDNDDMIDFLKNRLQEENLTTEFFIEPVKVYGAKQEWVEYSKFEKLMTSVLSYGEDGYFKSVSFEKETKYYFRAKISW